MYSIKFNFKEIGRVVADGNQMALNRDHSQALLDTKINLRFPLNTVNFMTSWQTNSSSRKTPSQVIS
jgi:hypothetical protein